MRCFGGRLGLVRQPMDGDAAGAGIGVPAENPAGQLDLPGQGFGFLPDGLTCVGKTMAPLRDAKLPNRYFFYLSRLLRRANRDDIQPSHLLFYQGLLGVGAALVFGFLSGSPELSVLAFAGGSLAPVLWVRDKALAREKELLKELPNALEILSLCSEAGLSLEQSMDQYLRHSRPGALHVEFTGILEQARSGSSRKNALEAAGARLNLTDFSLFAASLIQAERFGTGVSKTLRQLSLTLRDKQSQRAEKAVQEMPVKMLLPLILFIMPVTFLIIFGPILLQYFHP